MRLLYFTDTHIRANSPISRLDNFEETLKEKIKEVAKIGENEKVDFYIHGGDLFDRPDVSVRTVGNFGLLFQDFKKPIYIISGNHDIYGHNPNTIGRSMLGLLSQLDIFRLIDKDKPVLIKDGDLTIQISGSPYIYDIDGKDKSNYHPSRLPGVDKHILITHSLLLDKTFIEDIDYSLIDQVQDPDIDLVLAGHYHTGFGQIMHNETLFVNPGSLVRIANTKPERERIPSVAIIDISKEKIECRILTLKSAKPGKEVLNDKRDDALLRMNNIESFKLLMRQNIDIDSYDIKDMIIEISKDENIPKDILEMALDRLAKAEMYNEKD